MAQSLSDSTLSRISELVAHQIGLHFPKERWSDLERGVQSVSAELGVADAEACAQQILSEPLNKSRIELLASALTVGETYFFRDKSSFAAIAEHVLPPLIQTRRSGHQYLRIWSAGCCTGEEPYSLAILLDREVPETRNWHITILGTDVNPRFLEKATSGTFGDWSFRDAPAWLKPHYFEPAGPRLFKVLPRIRKRVTFACLNLAEDSYPSLSNNTNAMDLIFCRNVLMYFSSTCASNVVRNFHRALVEEGCLVTTAVEASSRLFAEFHREELAGAALFRKSERRSNGSSPFGHPNIDDGMPAKVGISSKAAVPSFSPPPKPREKPAVPSAADPLVKRPNIENILEAGLALFEKGDYSEAVRVLTIGANSKIASSEFLSLLARASANAGDLVDAQTWAQKAVLAEKLNPTLHYLQALIFEEQEEFAEAVASLQRALFLDPEFVLGHFALGNRRLRESKFKEANKHFDNALALLGRLEQNAVLPGSDGLVAGRLKALIESTKAAAHMA